MLSIKKTPQNQDETDLILII